MSSLGEVASAPMTLLQVGAAELAKGITRAVHAINGWTAEAAAETLRANRTEKSIIFVGSRFSVEEVRRIAEALKENQSCDVIKFGAAGLTHQHIQVLAEALQHNATLKVLDLSGNPFGDEGAKALAHALLSNPRSALVVLQMKGCNVGDEGLRHLGRAARQSQLRVLGVLGGIAFTRRYTREGLRHLRRLFAEPRVQRLQDSTYKKCYDKATACATPERLFECVQTLLEEFKKAINDQSLEPENFTDLLKYQVKQVKEKKKPDLNEHVDQVAAVLWTSAVDSGGIRLYEAINHVLRCDLDEAVMKPVVTFCRTLNLQLGNRRTDEYLNLPWPETLKLYRGTWMPHTEIEFLEENRQFRIQQFLATSEKPTVADRFINGGKKFGIKRGLLPVRIIIMIPEEKCKHATLLEKITCCNDEKEWLFTAYSAFTVVSNPEPSKKATDEDPIQITIKAFTDNLDADENLPVALWC